jgi:trehalose 6-phosphate phosphatase
LSDLASVVQKACEVLSHRPSALVTDIDGTISHLVANPQDAFVSLEIKESLRRLVRVVDSVAVVTARENSVARRMVGVEGLTYVGSYALNASAAATPRDGADIRAVREAILPFLARMPVVTLELKDVSFALHYRNAPDKTGTRARLISFVEPVALEHGAKIMEGKQVIEVVPADLPDKGTAFGAMVDERDIKGVIFMGDDLSDVAILHEMRRRRKQGLQCLGIAVVDEETPMPLRASADMTLNGVDEVEKFLLRLAGLMAAAQPA